MGDSLSYFDTLLEMVNPSRTYHQAFLSKHFCLPFAQVSTGFLHVSNGKQLSTHSTLPLMTASRVSVLFQCKRWVCPSPHSWTCCHLKWHTCLLDFVNHCLNVIKFSWNTGEKDRKKRSRKMRTMMMKKKMVGNCGYPIKARVNMNRSELWSTLSVILKGNC